MNYFIAYDSNNPKIVWGSGQTEKAALRDAKAVLKQWASWTHQRTEVSKKIKLKVVPCDYSVVDYVDTHSGGNVPWALHKKVAHLIALDL